MKSENIGNQKMQEIKKGRKKNRKSEKRRKSEKEI